MNKLALILSVVALVGAACFLIFVWPGTSGLIGGGSTACTMEALVCPDGSAVGRSGPRCEFLACPNQESFTGELSQQGGQFFLIIPAPDTLGGEVTYALPLEVKVSNVLGQLVGKTVRAQGEFKVGSTLVVSLLEEVTGAAANTVELGVGQSGYAGGVNITFHQLVQDNRCPIDAMCIEAGGVTARVTLKSDTDQETRNFPSDEAPYPFDTFQISIVGIKPARLSAQEPLPDTYRLTFKVEPLES